MSATSRATWTPLHESRNGHTLETEEIGVRYYTCRRDDPVLIDNRASVLQIANTPFDKDSPPTMPTGTASTSHILDSEAYRTIGLLININVTL